MLKKRLYICLLGLFLSPLALMVFSTNLQAQTFDALGSFTPYSLFGVGDINRGGTALNRGMGGIGTGLRDNRFINYLNPAAASAHDTLSFMLDFGLQQGNFYSADASHSSAYNAFNMNHIMMSFPIYKSSAMQLGIIPYSNVGYKFMEDDLRDEILNSAGAIRYYYYGQGSINQAFMAYSASFFKHVSLGIQGMYYFGNIERNAQATSLTNNTMYGTLKTGYDVVISSFGAQAGIQVYGNFSPNVSFTLGGTYKLATDLNGDMTRFARTESSSSVDTIYTVTTDGAHMTIPAEWSAGFSIRKRDKWAFGVDYNQSDWTNASFTATPDVNFKPTLSRSLKAGFEITPDRYSIRYYMRRWTYRVGAYYEQTYMSMNGQQIDARGITLGFTVPIYRYYNSVSLSIDLGERGSLENSLVRERYAMLILNVSLHDIWFQKARYD